MKLDKLDSPLMLALDTAIITIGAVNHYWFGVVIWSLVMVLDLRRLLLKHFPHTRLGR